MFIECDVNNVNTKKLILNIIWDFSHKAWYVLCQLALADSKYWVNSSSYSKVLKMIFNIQKTEQFLTITSLINKVKIWAVKCILFKSFLCPCSLQLLDRWLYASINVVQLYWFKSHQWGFPLDVSSFQIV